ncbi:hypothetical protein VP1G_01541 [Cytospora mali]|uniref:Uncharacterized protein n=1 Tax=Cytospora mali TaxID=578113 RepID=A0A194URN9_CYTMA|nr:hypothetical protein VP1G_01541 [Valsa mali var. pyri (nom. inval.)]
MMELHPIGSSTDAIIAFTTALFLSGYVIQQRTVRNLRAAIKPNTSPQVYLPDYFRTDTEELADGTLVVLDEYNRPIRQRIGKPRDPAGQVIPEGNGEHDGEAVVVEVKETLPEDVGQEQDQRAMAIEQLQKETEQAENPEQQQHEVEEPLVMSEKQPVPQPAPWEVRAEGARLGDEDLVESPDDETKKPISRAERRRLIKEEISRLSQGEQPVYYQRRLW